MLVQFSVSNFRSFNDKQTLSLVASNYYEEHASNKVKAFPRKKQELLKTAAIYGANSSGKSNLLKALGFMKRQILSTNKSPNERIETNLFKLSKVALSSASEFEVVFIENGKKYQYGFSCTTEFIQEEWLFVDDKEVLSRVYNTDSKMFEYPIFKIEEVSDDVVKVWKTLAANPNNLFVTKAVSNGSTFLQPVVNWFENRLIIKNQFGSDHSTKTIEKNLENRQMILEFMQSMGLKDIEAIQTKPIDTSKFDFPKDWPDDIKEQILSDLKTRREVKFQRKMNDSYALIDFDLEADESEGTKALFGFAGYLFDALALNHVILVDEIDSSLHPLAVNQLINFIHQQKKTKAQLIFTTHDTSILSSDTLRRDQVWFTEKTPSLATDLYSLADLSPRKDEAIESRYLNGRYGGVPILHSLDF